MSYCSFDSKKESERVVGYVRSKLNSVYLKENKPFTLEGFLKAAYRELSTKKNSKGELIMSPEKALVYVRHMPEVLAAALGVNRFGLLLADDATAILKLKYKLQEEASAEELLQLVSAPKVDSQTEEEKKKAAKAAQKRQKEEEKKRKKAEQEADKTNQEDYEYSSSLDPDTTSNKESSFAPTPGQTGTAGQYLEDPIVKANGKFRRSIIREESPDKVALGSNQRRHRVSISNSKYELRLVHGSRVSDADRIKPVNAKTGKVGDLYSTSVVILYINKETGQPVRINDEGVVVEEGGYLAHSWFRRPSKVKSINEEVALLHADVYANIMAKPDTEYTLQISGGYLGFSSNVSPRKNLISFLEKGSPLSINKIVIKEEPVVKQVKDDEGNITTVPSLDKDGNPNTLTRMFVDIEGYDYLALVDANNLGWLASSQNDTLLSATVQLLKSGLDNTLIIDSLNGWLQTEDAPHVSIEDGRLYLTRAKKFIDEITATELADIISNVSLNNVITSENITIPVVENDTVKFTSISREEFIRKYYSLNVANFYNSQGNQGLQTAHADIQYARDFSSVRRITETKLEILENEIEGSTSTETTPQTLSEKQRKDKLAKLKELREKRNQVEERSNTRIAKGDLLDKLDSLSNAATEEQMAAAEEWWNIHPLSKFIPLNRAFGIARSGALATWGTNGITLYAGSNYTDVYHEAWHGFSQLVLTKEEKIALYNEARKIVGNKSYRDVEEELAEDFRRYMLSEGKRVFGKSKTINSIYKKILEMLKALFGNRSFITDSLARAEAYEAIEEMYEKLNTGELAETRGPAWENYMFADLNKGIQLEDGTTISSANSRFVKEAMDSAIVSVMEKMDADVNVLFEDLNNIESLYEEVKDNLELAKIDLEIQLSELELAETLTGPETVKLAELKESISILEDAIEAYGTVRESREADARFSTVAYHLQNSELMSVFSGAFENADESNELSETDDLFEALEAFDKSGNELSQLELMDRRIKLLLSTVPERDATGNKVLDRFGLPKIYTFGKVYNDIQTELADVSTRDEMYQRLIDAKEKNDKRKASGRRYNNVYEHILGQIGAINSMDPIKQLLSGLLWQGFNLAHIVNKQIFAKPEEGAIKLTVKNPEGDTSKLRKYLQGRFISNNPKGVNYKEVIERYSKEDLLRSSKIYRFLYDLGIELDYSLELDNYLNQPDVIAGVQLMYTEIKDNLVPILGKNALEVKEPLRVLNRSRSSKAKGLKYEGQSGRISGILNFVLGLTPGMSISRRIAADGKNVYDLSLNSTQSQLTKALNNAESLAEISSNKALAHLNPETNPYANASYWLKAMFPNGFKAKSGRAKIVLQHFLGVFSELVSEKNTNLTTSSKILADLHTIFLTGYSEQFRASDKSTSYMVNVNTQIPGAIGAKKGLFFKSSHRSISPQTGLDFFKEKLRADILNALRHKNATTNLQKKVGSNLSFFSAIFTEKSSDPMMISKAEVVESLIEQEQDFDQWYAANEKRFEQMITAYFDGKVESLISDINFSKFKKLLNPEIASDLDLTTDEDVKLVLRNMIMNQWLINTEIATLFVGDLSQFKDANDFTKRFALTSTGKLFATDENTQNFINAQGNKYAEEVLGLKPSETKQYDGTGNTVILRDLDNNVSDDGTLLSPEFIKNLRAYAKDNKISAKKIKELIEDYKSKYNEADAQAFITLDSYRQLAIASQNWDWKSHEPLYQKIVKAAAEGGDISYADVVAAKKFFPVRKYQYYGPLLNAEVNGQKAEATALHKYSLKPIIPTPKGQPRKAIDVIHDAMVKSKVDYIVFESGSKVNNVNEKVAPYEFSKADAKGHVTRQLKDEGVLASEFGDNVNVIHFDYLKDVTKVKDTYKNKATASSQLRNLLPIGIYENGKVLPGKEAAAEAYENYLSSMQEYLTLELDKLRAVFQERTPKSILKVVERIKRDLEKRDASEEEIEAVDQLITNGGNIDALPNADRIETIITNIFNKRLIKTKLKGEALVQVSSAFMETLDAPSIGYSNDLRFYEYDQEGKTIKAAQAKVALQGDFIKLLALNYKGKPIKTLARLNEAIKDEQWLNKGNNRKMITISGVRIPVQGHNSMEVLEIVEFLDPANGTAIVVPSELPVKSGGDFDVDKLTLFFPRIKVGTRVKMKTDRTSKMVLGYLSPSQIERLQKKYPTAGINSYTVDTVIDFIKENKKKSIDSEYEGEVVYTLDSQDMAILDILMNENLVPTIDYVVSLDKQGQAGAQNEMLDSIKKIVLDSSNYLNLIKPNDVNQVRENSVAYNTYEARNKAKTADESVVGTALDYGFNIRKLRENSVGKRTLGIVASNNVIIALLSRITSKLPEVITDTDYQLFDIDTSEMLLPVSKEGLGKNYDLQNQNLKTSIVEQLINGFVDIAKGAWVFNIGADYYSTPVLLSLIAAGVNYDYAVAMINTPMMKEMFRLKAEKKDPLFLIEDDKLKSSSPERTVIKNKTGAKEVKWKNVKSWMDRTLANKETPSLEELLNDADGSLAFAMYLQARPMLNQINSLMRAVKVDTVTSSSIQDSIQVVKTLDNLTDFTRPLAAQIADTSVQGIYEFINRSQVNLLREWFPVRALDYGSVTENYTKLLDQPLMYMSDANRKKLFSKLNHHFVSYLYQNENTTSFKDLKDGTSKLMYNSDIEFTGKIDVPVLYVENKAKILINTDLLEQKFFDQKKNSFTSYERSNGVKFTYQGDFIIHEIQKAITKARKPELTDDEVAHRVLTRSKSRSVLFDAGSNYNIVSLFKAIEAEANTIADSDLIEKIRPHLEGNMVSLRIAYSIADPSEYKEDIRKLSQVSGPISIFFRLLSERIALQDNFETYEGSLMPYILDKDLAESLSPSLDVFAKMSPNEKVALTKDFINKFGRIADTKSYLSFQSEVEPGAKSKKTVDIEGEKYDILSITTNADSNYVVEITKSFVDDTVLRIVISKSGEVVGLDDRETPRFQREYGVELGAKTDLTVKEEPLETTTLTDEEVLEAIRKCNIG